MSQMPSESCDAENTRPQHSGCFSSLVTVFLLGIGVFWLISGSIILPGKAIYITGTAARLTALLWLAVWLVPPVCQWKQRLERKPDPSSQEIENETTN